MTNNKDIFYQELRKNAGEVQKRLTSEESLVSKLTDAAAALIWLSEIARKEGLLAIEEAAEGELDSEEDANRVSALILGDELRHMVVLVVDGTEPDAVEDIALKRYFARDYKGLEGFLYLIYLDGVLNIQAGENPLVFREKIFGVMPEQVNEKLRAYLDEEKAIEIKTSEDRWSELFNKTLRLENCPEYYVIRLLEYCLESMSDQDLQRTLRDVDNYNLVLALKILGGVAIKKVHDNLSPRLASMILEDMDYMGPVRFKDVVDADSKILRIILRLGEKEEITVPGKLDSIFAVQDIKKDDHDEENASDLKHWFFGMTNRDIQRVLKDIPRDTLAVAMRNWDQELRRLIYANLPRPVAGIIMDYMERTDYSNTEEAKANEMIGNTIRRLEDCGEVYLRG